MPLPIRGDDKPCCDLCWKECESARLVWCYMRTQQWDNVYPGDFDRDKWQVRSSQRVFCSAECEGLFRKKWESFIPEWDK